MDFKNWFLLFSILGIIGFSAYYIAQDPTITREASEVTPQVADSYRERPADWREYSGETLKFYHPESWDPEIRESFGEAVIENIALNIPDATYDSISYSAVSYEILKPDDVVKEEELILNDRKWVKWVRGGEGYVIYDFYTKEQLEDEEVENIGVHVALSDENNQLEEELLVLISSLEFRDGQATNEASLESIE